MFCLFLSHQWLGDRHCDPDGRQMDTLRSFLQRVICGSSKVHGDLIGFIGFEQVSTLSADECKDIQNGFLWIDWASIPQLAMCSPGRGGGGGGSCSTGNCVDTSLCGCK